MHIINFLLHIASFQALANAFANPIRPSSDAWFPPVVENGKSKDIYFTESQFKRVTNTNAKEFIDIIKSQIRTCFRDNKLKIGKLVVSPTYLNVPRKKLDAFHAAIDLLGKNTLWHTIVFCEIDWSAFIPQNAMDSFRELSIKKQTKHKWSPLNEKEMAEYLVAWVAELFDRCMTMAWSQLLDVDSIAIELPESQVSNTDKDYIFPDYIFELGGLKNNLKIPIYTMTEDQFQAPSPKIINTGKSYIS
jgi:hypothetical protein